MTVQEHPRAEGSGGSRPAPAAIPELGRPALAAPAPSAGREVRLDPVSLARAGITLPSLHQSRTVEEFRMIKRGLLAGWSSASGDDQDGPSHRLMMVTSARPAEGKTFVAINLALALAVERDLHVLLVDCDSYRPSVPQRLGIAVDGGLVDVLSGTRDMAEVILRTSIPNLSLLPSGGGGPNVPELLSSNRMSGLAAEMTQRYPDRFILFDAPPCLASSDPATLAPLVGQIVFVVEAGETQQEEVESSIELLRACPRISLVLNKAEAGMPSQFGSYSYY